MRVRSVTCSSCGGRTRLDHGLQEAQCLHCGQPVRLSQAVMEEQQRAAQFPPATPLRLGMKAQFRGREYEVTGRQVMRQNDEGTIYQWEEFVLVSPDGDLLYLEFDEGKWKVSEPFVPETPLEGAQLAALAEGSWISLDGHGALVTDAGVYQTVFAEGEFPWIIHLDRYVSFVDATYLNTFYSIGGTEDEIEYYRGDMLSEQQVASMFGLNDWLRQIERQGAGLRSRKRFGGLCVALGTFSIIFWIASFFSGAPVPNASSSVDLARVGPDGARYGPFDLASRGRVHRLEIQGQMQEASNWVQAILEDEDEAELVGADKDMWDESGSDSDGPWHESDLNASSDFVLVKPGGYYVRLYAEADPGRSLNGQASFVLRQNAFTPLWPGVYGFVALILGFVFLAAGSPSTVKSMKESLQSSDDD